MRTRCCRSINRSASPITSPRSRRAWTDRAAVALLPALRVVGNRAAACLDVGETLTEVPAVPFGIGRLVPTLAVERVLHRHRDLGSVLDRVCVVRVDIA